MRPMRTWSKLLALATLVAGACGKDEAPPARSSGASGEQARSERDRPAKAPAGERKAIDPATVGGVRGVVHFEGKAPERKKIDMSAVGGCPHDGNVLTEQVIVNDGRVQNVLVRVKSGLEAWIVPPAPSEPAVMNQKGCVYTPHVLPIRVGQPLVIQNSDDATHNVNVRAKRRKNENFNQIQMPGQAPIEKTFGEVEVAISFECNLHPWMNAWVAVVDHPFCAVSGPDGSFSIEGLPPGEYELEAWHERLGRATARVTVAQGTSAEASFTLKAP